MNAARLKSKRSADVYVSLKGTNCPQKCVHWHFHFILPIMPDKTAFMSVDRAGFCVQLFSSRTSERSAIHLIQFGNSERKSFGPVRDFRARSRVNWVNSGHQRRVLRVN